MGGTWRSLHNFHVGHLSSYHTTTISLCRRSSALFCIPAVKVYVALHQDLERDEANE